MRFGKRLRFSRTKIQRPSPRIFRQRFLIEGRTDWTKPYLDPNDRRARYARRDYFRG